ncbi:MAG: HD domain-containing protein [Oscillospiraceae bacterium]|nr:HD domain-containing protein [Oscillospiraceae bacterium]
MTRLEKQLGFLLECDRMKSIYRQTYILADESRGASMREFEGDAEKHARRENDAEHSFHLVLFAMILSEYSNEPVDLLKVIKMVTVHDIVEIDAGDTYCYDKEGNKTKADREKLAADRLFGLLPEEQKKEFRGLWEEFERADTPESRFANALDRMQPMLLNYTKGGISWKEHGAEYDMVYNRNHVIKDGSDELWEYISQMLDKAEKQGMLTRK